MVLVLATCLGAPEEERAVVLVLALLVVVVLLVVAAMVTMVVIVVVTMLAAHRQGCFDHGSSAQVAGCYEVAEERAKIFKRRASRRVLAPTRRDDGVPERFHHMDVCMYSRASESLVVVITVGRVVIWVANGWPYGWPYG